MKSITKIFIELDKTIKVFDQLKNEIGWGKVNYVHDPKGQKVIQPFKEHPLIKEVYNEDGCGVHFIFESTHKSQSNGGYYSILETSNNFRIPLYKDKNVEVGITMEDRLRSPNSDVWSYHFSGDFQYYIIKNGETIITNSRSWIRKIYNDIPAYESNNIKYDAHDGTHVIGVENIIELEHDCYLVETENGDEFYIGEEEDLIMYWVDGLDNETWMSELGGPEKVLEWLLDGGNFDKYNYWIHGNRVWKLLDVEEPPYKQTIEWSTFDSEEKYTLQGKNIFKRIL